MNHPTSAPSQPTLWTSPLDALAARVEAQWHDDERLAEAIEWLATELVTEAKREQCAGTLWPHEIEADSRARSFLQSIRDLPEDCPVRAIVRGRLAELVEGE